VPRAFGGYPWQPETRRILERESPLTYVEAMQTPLLIQHGDNDRRTGFVQSEMLLRSLKVLGRDVESVRYPRASHEMSRSGEPRQRLDSLVRYDEFFRRYIGEN
jgi:dipeptidyl aminopeptidase/acylaminoacyl peptidase